LSHASLIGALPGFVASQNWFPQKGDVFWTPADWSWSSGLMNALLPTLYFGQAIVGTLGHFSSARSFELLARYRVSNMFVLPTMLHKMMQDYPSLEVSTPLAVRAIASAGEPVGTAAFDWCQRTLGISLNEMYGQAETSHIIGNSYRKWPARAGSMGKPYPGHRVAVLDSRGRPCRAGTVGEIAVNRLDMHGHPDPSLFLRYWQNDDATRARFNGDWYMTGDLASVDPEGYYWHAGRS